jgi:hypothetical protein
MSEILVGVLRMPADLFWSDDVVTRVQHDAIRLEAADEIDHLRAQVDALWSRIETAAVWADGICASGLADYLNAGLSEEE